MISTLALMGFLALIFLLAYRIGMACEPQTHIRQQRPPRQPELAGRKIEQRQLEIPPEGSEPLVPLQQV